MKIYKSLQEIAKDYDYVVFDTSVLDATNAPLSKRVKYRKDLEDVFNQADNIVTIDNIRMESKKIIKKGLKGIKLRRIAYYREIFDYLKPLAEKGGIVDNLKEYPLADVRLAAFALGLAYHAQKIAFASSDRKLNNFVTGVIPKIKNEEHPRFPKKINHCDIYSFVQRTALFIPYEEEIKTRKRVIHNF